MRILHWVESYHPRIGGMEVFSKNLVEKLKAQGHECFVLTDDYGKLPSQENVDGIPVYRFGFRSAFEERNLPAIIGLTRQVEDLKRFLHADVIHLHTSQCGGFYFLRTQAISPVPSVYTTHDPILQISISNSMVQQILRKVSRIAAISAFMFQRTLECVPNNEKKMRLLLNAHPMPDIDPSPLLFEPAVFIGLGRLVPEKGFDLLLDAFNLVKKKHPLVKLILAGDGPAGLALQNQADELGISDSVDFRGWIHPQSVPALINESTIVVVPSRWQEPFGLVALQAMQMARPVLAARVGGLPEIIQDRLNGLLFEGDKAESLSNAMLNLLTNPNLARQMGKVGRQNAEKNFNWNDCAMNYQSIYQEVTA